MEAAKEAYSDADCHDAVARDRVGVVAGTTEGDEHAMWGVAAAIRDALELSGPCWTVSTACTSSPNAIGLGLDLLKRGDVDAVIAGGAERLLPEMVAGFFRLGVLTAGACSPFGETRGTSLAEGAGFIVLQRARDAKRAPWAYLDGYGLASDAFAETTPEPRGEGIARAMRGCMRASGLQPDDIDYVNVHGTGTAANDDSEWRGIKKALDDRASAIPLSATKSFLGHAQGAAGVLELAATLVCMREGTIPPTLRVGSGRPNGPPDPVSANAPRPHEVRSALCNSAAFGGANAVLSVSAHEREPLAVRRDVHLVGFTTLTDREARLSHVRLDAPDPSGRMVTVAAGRALAEASIRVRGTLRDRVGIFTGTSRVSPASSAEFRESIERGGIGRASAAAFAKLVLHAPAGTASSALALRGPTTTVADDAIAGFLAFAYAADHLMRRDDADALVAVGFDEAEGEGGLEGATAHVLVAAPNDHDLQGGAVRIAAIASAGPGRVSRAVSEACARAELAEPGEPMRFKPGEAPSMRSAAWIIEAAGRARRGGAPVLAVADGPHVCCAIVIDPREATNE